jgi:hypothetical protein
VVFWVLTLCNDVVAYRSSVGSRCLHLYGSDVRRNVGILHHYTVSQPRISRLDGGRRSYETLGILPRICKYHNPEDKTSRRPEDLDMQDHDLNLHRRENLIFRFGTNVQGTYLTVRIQVKSIVETHLTQLEICNMVTCSESLLTNGALIWNDQITVPCSSPVPSEINRRDTEIMTSHFPPGTVSVGQPAGRKKRQANHVSTCATSATQKDAH